jgi:hypothetical protein
MSTYILGFPGAAIVTNADGTVALVPGIPITEHPSGEDPVVWCGRREASKSQIAIWNIVNRLKALDFCRREYPAVRCKSEKFWLQTGFPSLRTIFSDFD